MKLKVSMVIGVLPGLNKADVAVRHRRLDFQPAVLFPKPGNALPGHSQNGEQQSWPLTTPTGIPRKLL